MSNDVILGEAGLARIVELFRCLKPFVSYIPGRLLTWWRFRAGASRPSVSDVPRR